VSFPEEVNLLTRLPIVCYYINRIFSATASVSLGISEQEDAEETS
jgi:hypothetical protein